MRGPHPEQPEPSPLGRSAYFRDACRAKYRKPDPGAIPLERDRPILGSAFHAPGSCASRARSRLPCAPVQGGPPTGKDRGGPVGVCGTASSAARARGGTPGPPHALVEHRASVRARRVLRSFLGPRPHREPRRLRSRTEKVRRRLLRGGERAPRHALLVAAATRGQQEDGGPPRTPVRGGSPSAARAGLTGLRPRPARSGRST